MFRRISSSLTVAALSASSLLALQGPPPPAPSPDPGAEAVAQAAQPPLTFRVEANFVEVDAFVSDPTGNPVTDLRATDFQLFEDGKPQKVSAFSYVNIPVARPERPLFSAAAIEPDVQTNIGIDGRIYLFVLDDLHVDPIRALRVRESLRRFFERNFGVNDLAAVVFTGGRTADGQDFTNSPRLLLAAVDKFSGNKLRSATLERLDECSRLQSGACGGGRPDQRSGRDGLGRNARVHAIAAEAVGLHGGRAGLRRWCLIARKSVRASQMFSNNALGSDIVDATRDAIAAATRANVSIYAIDPRGSRRRRGADRRRQASSPTIQTSAWGSIVARGLRLHADTCGRSPTKPAALPSPTGTISRRVRSSRPRQRHTVSRPPGERSADGKFPQDRVRLTRPGSW
jgi:VWFA-related protein